MMNWDDNTIVKFLRLLCKNEVRVEYIRKPAGDGKHNDLQISKFHEALEGVARSMNLPNLSLPEVIKKTHYFRDIYSNEIFKVKRDPRYTPGMVWFPELEQVFNNKTKRKGAQPNHSTDGGENSNQSLFNGLDETREDSEDIENLPTQLNKANYQRCLSKEPAVPVIDNNPHSIHLPVNHNPLIREDEFQIPENAEQFITNDEMVVSHDYVADNVDVQTGTNDETLCSFANYLVSLLRQIPLANSYQLQQKFITETMNTTIKLENERAQLQTKKRKREATSNYNRLHPSTSVSSNHQHSRGDLSSNMHVPNSNDSTSLSLRDQGTGQALSKRANTSGGTYGINGGVPGPEITFEEGPQIGLIKKELETNVELAFCNGNSSFGLM